MKKSSLILKAGLILYLVSLSLNLTAQFEDEFENDRPEVKSSSEPARTEVDSRDLKALFEAKSSKSEEALVRAASRILGIDSKNKFALNALGVHYFEQGKYGLSRLILSRALKDHEQEPALHNNLGIVYLAENKQRLALASFRRALELKSDYKLAAGNLGSIFLEYKDFERALKPLESGYRATRAELKSGTPYAMEVANNYAIALTGAGKFKEAQEIYEEIISGSSKNAVVLLNYAILLIEKLNEYKEGSKLISKIKFASEDSRVLKRAEELEAKVASGGSDK